MSDKIPKIKRLVDFKRDPTLASFNELQTIADGVLASVEKSQGTADSIKKLVDDLSIAKLVGPQGPAGKDGEQGPAGKDGKDGRDGRDGKDGKDGEQGPPGPAGKDGKPGPRGETGMVGPAGLDGSPDTGEDIVKKINSLEITPGKQIDAKHIKNLPKIIEQTSQRPIHRGGQQIAIKDEGTQITATVKTINFVGSNVAATASSDNVTVTISSESRLVELPISPPTVGMATGDSQQCFVVDAQYNGWKLVSPNASVVTASTSGLPTFQIRNATQGYDILSTPITIDVSEKDSTTATTTPVVDTTKNTLTTGDQIMIDVDVAGGSATGDIVRFVIQPA